MQCAMGCPTREEKSDADVEIGHVDDAAGGRRGDGAAEPLVQGPAPGSAGAAAEGSLGRTRSDAEPAAALGRARPGARRVVSGERSAGADAAPRLRQADP